MKVEIESANDDPVDDLIVNNSTGPITGSPAVSGLDMPVPGLLSRTLTWTGDPPTDITLNVLWSKVSFAGNWLLGTTDITVPFAATCATGPTFTVTFNVDDGMDPVSGATVDINGQNLTTRRQRPCDHCPG